MVLVPDGRLAHHSPEAVGQKQYNPYLGDLSSHNWVISIGEFAPWIPIPSQIGPDMHTGLRSLLTVGYSS
jgi:hypothetical protein